MILAALLLAVVAWGAVFIVRTSFVVDGRRVFCLFDDPMISMTYARNLVEGFGLNWARQGAPVEGFSHPLWLVPMILANLSPLPLEGRSLVVQLVSLVTLLLTVVEVRRLTLEHFAVGGARHWLSGAAFAGFYYPLAYWALVGMETGLQALLTLIAVRLALTAVHRGGDRHVGLWLICTAAVLLRLDLLIVVAWVQGYLLLGGGLRPAGRRSWFVGLGVFLFALLGYQAFRWFYFHDLLPNTYYLKLAGAPLAVRVARGGHYLWDFARQHVVFLTLTSASTAWFARRDRSRAWLLPVAVLGAAAVYDVYVGGDAWDGLMRMEANRFVAFVMPLAFVLWNGGINTLLEALPTSPRFLRPALLLALLLVTAVDLGGLGRGFRRESWRRLALRQPPPLVDDGRKVYETLRELETILAPPAVVATIWAGIPAYFSDYRMVDILGYNDRATAHGPHRIGTDPRRPLEFRPGHTKWDLYRLFVESRPDAFFQWPDTRRGMPAGYERIGSFWCRRDSPHLKRRPRD